jgi:hypothetical protein
LIKTLDLPDICDIVIVGSGVCILADSYVKEAFMKKVIMLAVVLAIVAGFVFAADGYVVQSVTGKVEREVSPGKWEAVSSGATLTPATVINTSLNSSLVLSDGNRTITIKAMQKGTVETLAGAGSTTGIKAGGKVSGAKTETAARGNSNISTASTRASNAASYDPFAPENQSE